MEMPDKIYAVKTCGSGGIFDVDNIKALHCQPKGIYHHSRIVEDLKENLAETVIALAARNSDIIELRLHIAELEAIIEARGM